MTLCKKIKQRKRQVCVGALRHRIEIETRTLTPPALAAVDYGETFSNTISVMSHIETVSGETVFDKTNVETLISHRFYIRFRTDVTAESWIKFNSEFYDILTTENLDNKGQFLLLRCNKRGDVVKPVNVA